MKQIINKISFLILLLIPIIAKADVAVEPSSVTGPASKSETVIVALLAITISLAGVTTIILYNKKKKLLEKKTKK